MKKEELVGIIRTAIRAEMATEAFEQRIGTIVQKAIDSRLIHSIEMVNREEATKAGEEPVQKEFNVNVLAYLPIWMSKIEGDMRGLQGQMRKEMGYMAAAVGKFGHSLGKLYGIKVNLPQVDKAGRISFNASFDSDQAEDVVEIETIDTKSLQEKQEKNIKERIPLVMFEKEPSKQ